MCRRSASSARSSLPSVEEDARVRTLLLMDDASEPPILYQVPVVEREDRLHSPAASDHLIGRLPDGRFLYDGPHDRAYTDALLAMIVSAGRATPQGADASGRYSGGATPTDGDRAAASARPPLSAPSTVLGGEQSNTSIIFRPAESAPIICKVFRQLHDGDNPDVTLQTELAVIGVAARAGEGRRRDGRVGRRRSRVEGVPADTSRSRRSSCRASRTRGVWR